MSPAIWFSSTIYTNFHSHKENVNVQSRVSTKVHVNTMEFRFSNLCAKAQGVVCSPTGFREITTMPNPKGSKIANRSPQIHRTRSDSLLALEVQQQILVDLETYGKDVSAAQLSGTRKICGEPGSSLNGAVRRRVGFHRNLKQEDPKECW